MNQVLLLFLMFCGGVAVAFQPSINGRLAQKTGVLESSCISFTVGAAALLILVFLVGKGDMRGVSHAAWWELSGGLLGAFFVTMTIVAVPRIGTTAAMASVIAAQLATGALLDHFGMFGFREIPLDGKRAFGIALLMAGTALVFRR
ncbi:DMT family transporter [Geomobilimonas luticola]|uniref:DMT family transporter n=1 Tax=Geomobilimonas luticola TaxID=1114878 RepID=A0ABS5S7W3_9BACT|nr:DMT family transporter [Geomobilimonas luticola]MBT0651459.1 DMT family transporter [Geomobilimonas luticola]